MNDHLVLKKLSLINFVTFESVVIDFEQGLNTIIGETGSGKSLVLDALQLIFGQKANKKYIRKNTDFATIEAVFEADGVQLTSFFNEQGFPFNNNEVVIKRILYSEGHSKSYLNFQSVRRSTLVEFSKLYIDLVGQFENQKLLSSHYQLKLLDSYGKLTPEIYDYYKVYQEYLQLQNKLDQLKTNKQEREFRLDFLEYQIKELEKLSPSAEDEKNLLEKKKFFINYEKRQQLIYELTDLIYDSEHSLSNTSRRTQAIIQSNQDLFNETTLDLLIGIEDNIQQLYQFITPDNEEYDESIELDEIIEKLDLYQKLKRKYNVSTEELEQTLINFKDERDRLANYEVSLQDLELKINALKKSLTQKANTLHEKRLVTAKKLAKELTQKIRKLKMDDATFDISLTKLESFGPEGISQILFNAELNPGEGYHLVKDIASGGELSRILLAMRQCLTAKESISIFLFDEVDAGVGGKTALAIGKALQEVSSKSQVIAITHLPQIAKYATKIIEVFKTRSGGKGSKRTISMACAHSGDDKQKIVSQMTPLEI